MTPTYGGAAEAERLRTIHSPEPGPTDCGRYCGHCDSCVEFDETVREWLERLS